MAVEDILTKIKSDAEKTARGIVDEGNGEAERILGDARSEADALRARLKTRAEQRAEEERNRIVTLSRLASRRELLGEKQRLIDEVFEEARKGVLAMDRDEYRRFIRAFLVGAIESGNEEVIVGESENRIDQAFLDEVSREHAGGGGLRLSQERRPIEGGFILREGKTETNCGLDTILSDARERLETEVAAILFGPGE